MDDNSITRLLSEFSITNDTTDFRSVITEYFCTDDTDNDQSSYDEESSGDEDDASDDRPTTNITSNLVKQQHLPLEQHNLLISKSRCAGMNCPAAWSWR